MAFITTHLRENKWGWGDKTHTSKEDTHQLELSKDLECYIKKKLYQQNYTITMEL